MKLKFKYTPHEKQKQIHEACSVKSSNFWTIVSAGRQSGKSMCAKYQCINWALTNNNVTIWYVCPSENQAKIVWRDIMTELVQIPGQVKSKIQSKGDISITLNSGTRIEFKSAGAADSLRGSSVAFLILDESSWIKKETIEQIIIPTMAVAGRKILVISSPKGRNFFYEMFMRASSDEIKVRESYKSFHFTSLDNPEADKELIAEFKRTLPDAIFRQEFMAEWVDSCSVFSNVSELSNIKESLNHKINGDRYYMGIDIALADGGDYTVITILNQRGHMVYMDRFRGLEAPELRGRVLRAHQMFKPVKSLIEANNQGLPIIHELQREMSNLEGFYTSNDSKSEIINELIAAFAMKEIQIIDDKDLRDELGAFVFEYTKTGKIKFAAASGFHDDTVMSLAIAWHAYVKAVKHSGGYRVFGGGEDFTSGYVKEKKGFPLSPQILATRKTSPFSKILQQNTDFKPNDENDNNEFIFFSS